MDVTRQVLARVEGRLLSAGPGALIRLGLLASVVGRAHALEAALGPQAGCVTGLRAHPGVPFHRVTSSELSLTQAPDHGGFSARTA